MAGTMPHAVFVETGLPDGGAAAYAAELPGCAAFAATDGEAVADVPRRVEHFTAWLRERGEQVPSFAGGNWYEVERAAAADEARASFSLDELPPSEEEFERWLRWLELAREELAEALDDAGYGAAPDALSRIERQDAALAGELGGEPPRALDDAVDRLYAAREALTDALERAGASGDGVRGVLRLAIADDLRAAELLRAAAAPAA